MIASFNARARAGRRPPPITISRASIDETMPAGTPVGRLAAPGPGWRFHLADDAGGRFALQGDTIVVGRTPLSRAARPQPSLLVATQNGDEASAAVLTMEVWRPLPALPLAAGAKVVGLGHSMIDRSGWGIVEAGPPMRVSNISQSNARGVLPWIRMLDDRFDLNVFADLADPFPVVAGWGIGGAFQGISGDHLVATANLPGTIARTPYIASLRPAIVYLHIGENDVNSSVSSAAELIARLDRQLERLRAEGIWTVIQTLVHRGHEQWAASDPRHAIVADANLWILAQAGREGVRVCDTTGLGLNWPNFDPALFGTDTVHIAPEGARAIADRLLPILSSMVEAGAVSNHEALAGNLWPNAAFAGTAGTKSAAAGAVPTGQVASGHSLRSLRGGSVIVASKEADAGGFERQVVSITPVDDATAGRVHELRLAQTAAVPFSDLGIAAGDWLEAYLKVDLSAWDHWLSLTMQFELQRADGSYVLSVSSGLVNPDNATRPLLRKGNRGFSGWLKTCPFQVPEGAVRLASNVRPITLTWDKTGTGTGIAKLSHPILRKTGDPRPAWGL